MDLAHPTGEPGPAAFLVCSLCSCLGRSPDLYPEALGLPPGTTCTLRRLRRLRAALGVPPAPFGDPSEASGRPRGNTCTLRAKNPLVISYLWHYSPGWWGRWATPTTSPSRSMSCFVMAETALLPSGVPGTPSPSAWRSLCGKLTLLRFS